MKKPSQGAIEDEQKPSESEELNLDSIGCTANVLVVD
jgi:hypothetical protein